MSEWISLEIWIKSFGSRVEAKALAGRLCRNTAEKAGRSSLHRVKKADLKKMARTWLIFGFKPI